MPSFNNIGVFNINSQSGNIFIGETIHLGMDSNSKTNTAQGGSSGFNNLILWNMNQNFDTFDFADGTINDQDAKTNLGGNA